MVDPLFEAVTHSAVKSGLINGRAMLLHVHATYSARAYTSHTNDTVTRSAFFFFFNFLFRLSLKCTFNKCRADSIDTSGQKIRWMHTFELE